MTRNGSLDAAKSRSRLSGRTSPIRQYGRPGSCCHVAQQESTPLSGSGSQTEVRCERMIRAAPTAIRAATASRPVLEESSAESSSSAFALWASRRCSS